MKYIVYFFLAYLAGSIQPAYFLGKWVGKIDIREYGSKNAGASNVTIKLGWKYGVLTGVIDILKAVIVVIILKYVLNEAQIAWFIGGLGVLMGHIFPFYMGFRGGKGTASFIGMMLTIDYRIGLILAFTLIIVTLVTNYIPIGTYVIMIATPILLFIFHYSFGAICVATGISLLSLVKHFPNIIRIAKGEEIGLKSTFKNKSKE